MRSWFRSKQRSVVTADGRVLEVARLRDEMADSVGAARQAVARPAARLVEVIAATAVVAAQVLGLRMFDEQIRGALALVDGEIVEMQTGEGKTLAAVPAAVWLARQGAGVHMLTANDYLARRDAEWMRPVYFALGLGVDSIRQGQSTDERRQAYLADITYATANEVGFDLLRDGLALEADEQVHRGLHAAIIDEADSILIDEARLPLVIAGGADQADDIAVQADRAVRELLPGRHYTIGGSARNVLLTPAGVTCVERAMGCENLFDADTLAIHAAVQDALHAHVLLRRDVDYMVAADAVVPVDEFKGRTVADRRWPAGLQMALEAKERVTPRRQGRVLGSISVEHLVGHYAHVCGMTGTAATQAGEFKEVYGLRVRVIPTHRPVIRRDLPDVVFDTRAAKEIAARDEIRRIHASGQPVLVGTASVEESERLSRGLSGIPHHVLNARNEAEEAAIIARAGERGAVTISTNMAGRGVDIRLGPGVAELGGLHVIGTNRHESRRIDHQLRGRAGRQGDPGGSQFLVSREDPIVLKYGDGEPGVTTEACQRRAEGQNLEARIFLRRYESVIEAQRQRIAERRQQILEGRTPAGSTGERHARLAIIDDLWSDYLAAITELRSGSAWITLGYGNALGHYLREVHGMHGQLTAAIDTADPGADRVPVSAARDRGATWTYLTTDEPFGSMSERVLRRLAGRVDNQQERG